MKTCRKFPAGTVLVTAILGAVSLSPSRMAHAGPEKYERVIWDKGDARKVIARATAIDMGSTSEMLLRITAAALNNEPNRDETTYGVWLTDDVCWSLAVLVQEEKRRTDEEKEKLYEAFVKRVHAVKPDTPPAHRDWYPQGTDSPTTETEQRKSSR